MNVYQTKEWAEVCEKSRGWKPHFIEGFLFFERSKDTFFGKKNIIFSEGAEISDDLYEKIKPSIKSIKPFYSLFYAPFYYEGRSSLYRIANNTVIIDLSKSEEEIWNNLEKKSIRWGVKKAEKEGIKVKEAETESRIREFYNLYENTCKEGGLKPEDYSFFEAVHNILVPKGYAKILVAEKDGKIVSGAIILVSSDYVVLNLTGTGEIGQKLQANILIYWEIIKIGKHLKKKWFDLGGYDLEAKAGEKAYNINKFKERFGGQIVEQPIYTPNWRYYIARKIMQKMHFFKKIFIKK